MSLHPTTSDRSRTPRCRRCPGTPPAGVSNACCAGASSPSRPSSTARFRRCGGCLPPRRGFRRLGGWHQRHRRVGRPLPHVERRHLRAAHPRRLCADHADQLPGTTIASPSRATCSARPHSASATSCALPAMACSAATIPRRSRSSTSIRPRFRHHPHHARREALSLGPQAHDGARRVHGRAENPFAPPYDFRPLRLAKKVEAGAQFCQTQYCFDLPMMARFMEKVRDMGLDRRCFILAGVGPLASARTARWMRANVAGVHIPTRVIERLEGAPTRRPREKRICIEMISSSARSPESPESTSWPTAGGVRLGNRARIGGTRRPHALAA